MQTSEADRQKDLEKKISESETVGCERESDHSDPICTQENGRKYNQRTKEEVSPATRRTPKYKPRDTKRCYDKRSLSSLGQKKKVCERFDGSTYDQKTGKSLSAATRNKEEARQHALDHEDAQEKYKKSKYGTRDDKRCYMKGVPGFRKEVCERYDGSVYNKETGEEISGPTRTGEEAQQHAYEQEMKEAKEKKDPTIHCARKSTLSLDKICTRESGEEYDPKTGKVIKPAPGAEEGAEGEEADGNNKALVPSDKPKDPSPGGIVENRSDDDECEYPNPESRSMVCTTADGKKYDKDSGLIVDEDDDDFDDGDSYDAVDEDDDAESEEDDQFDSGDGDDDVDGDDGDTPEDDGGPRPRNLGDGEFDDGETPDGDLSGTQGSFGDGDDEEFGRSGDDDDGTGSGDGDDMGPEDEGLGEEPEGQDSEPFEEDTDDPFQEIDANETVSDIYRNSKRLKWSRDQSERDNRDKFLDETNLSSQVSSGAFGKNTLQNTNPITSLPDGFVQESRVRTGVNPFGNNSRFMKLNAMSRYEP